MSEQDVSVVKPTARFSRTRVATPSTFAPPPPSLRPIRTRFSTDEQRLASEQLERRRPLFTFYGAAKTFARFRGSEALIHGPAETGKTISALWKLHICAAKYKNASIVILRKVRDSIYTTTLRTYLTKVLDDQAKQYVKGFGGEKPEWFDYPSGSRIWIAGMDKPGKILSAEHDIIYVNQAEELSLEEWETLTTRTTGRAGHMPYSQTIGDCNPTYPSHWMYHRTSLRMFYSKHEDNPTLFDPRTGEITEQGKRTLAVLDALTGVRKQRLRYGVPSQAEGTIYEEWDESRHMVYDDVLPQMRYYIAGQDWGFTNPGVFGVFGVDGDGRLWLVRQVYQTGMTIDWWADTAVALEKQYKRFQAVVCDPAEPAYIKAYVDRGLRAKPGDNAILPGINAVKERLKKDRLFILRSSLESVDDTLLQARKPASVQDEFPAYVWSNKTAKEQPKQEFDHGMDMVRYVVRWEDRPRGWSRGPIG